MHERNFIAAPPPRRVRWARGSGLAALGLLLLIVACTAGLRRPRSVENGEGYRWVSLAELGRVYGLRAEAGAPDDRPVLTGSRRLEFESGSHRVRFDGTLIWMHHALSRHRAKWSVAQSDALEMLDPLLRPASHLERQGARRIMLDPGHGGTDGGTSYGRIQEKDLTLDLARKVRARLEAYGFEVRMTRDRDEFIPLELRAEQARTWEADLFISIHFNASSESSAHGTETYILSRTGLPSTNDRAAAAVSRRRSAAPGNRHDAPSVVLGYYLHRGLLRFSGGEDRGLRYARFVVLREAPCPAALVECGFLSHPGDRARIQDPAHMDHMARGLATGAAQYLDAVLMAQISPR
ncbi:MAG: N-acetylmuramoyl-L-alanine amidase [Kiritimatiellae bacterium]|nr:N-acetylmuramoyl-L-alanine amidase [Kiritimatiellia bacterium]